MKYINKVVTPNIGNIYLRFANSCWNIDESEYFGLEYDNDTDFISLIKEELLYQQDYLCCYCLRTIKSNTSTIEHIIPQKHNSSFSNYSFHNVDLVVDRGEWRSDSQILNLGSCENFPHDISFFNLVCSCANNKTCNSKRGNKVIEVPFFDRMLTTKVYYNNKGEIVSVPYQTAIDACLLNIDDYKVYRMIWQVIKEEDINNFSILIGVGINVYIRTNQASFSEIIHKAAIRLAAKQRDIRFIFFFDNRNGNNKHYEIIADYSFFYTI